MRTSFCDLRVPAAQRGARRPERLLEPLWALRRPYVHRTLRVFGGQERDGEMRSVEMRETGQATAVYVDVRRV